MLQTVGRAYLAQQYYMPVCIPVSRFATGPVKCVCLSLSEQLMQILGWGGSKNTTMVGSGIPVRVWRRFKTAGFRLSPPPWRLLSCLWLFYSLSMTIRISDPVQMWLAAKGNVILVQDLGTAQGKVALMAFTIQRMTRWPRTSTCINNSRQCDMPHHQDEV